MSGSENALEDWKEIEYLNENQRVREFAEWAVIEYNARNEQSLVFHGLLQGWEQMARAGKNYRLVLDAYDDSNNLNKYEAKVYDNSWEGYKELLSFSPPSESYKMNRSENTLEDWIEIEYLNENPRVREFAEWAVIEYNVRNEQSLAFHGLFQGWEQMARAGKNYRLVLDAYDDSNNLNKYEAKVYDNSWEAYKELLSFSPLLE